MNLKFILPALLAVWMLNPMLIKAQKNAKQDDVVQQTIIGEVNGIKIVEISNSATRAEKQKSDRDRSDKIQKTELDLNNFISGKTVWKMSDISIDQEKLSENKANYDKLLGEVKEELNLGIIYVEDSNHALLAATKPNLYPLYRGQFEELNGNVTLHHVVTDCESCSKKIVFQKKITEDLLTIVIQAEDDYKSDVYYILNFTKQ